MAFPETEFPAAGDFTSEAPPLKRHSLAAALPTNTAEMSVDVMDVTDLLALRARIDARLPPMDLAHIDMGQEIVMNLMNVKAILAAASKPDSGVPANQLAQLTNTCNTSVTILVKLQQKIWNSEMLKKLEAVLAKVIKSLPVAQQDDFLALYGRALGETIKLSAEDVAAAQAVVEEDS